VEFVNLSNEAVLCVRWIAEFVNLSDEARFEPGG
jgi:hypothetical protein